MWYSVDALIKNIVGCPEHNTLWEEVIFLVNANDETDAEDKIRNKLMNENCEYLAQSGETIKWEFDSILMTYEILSDQIADGTELFSRFLKKEEVASLKTPFDDL